MREREIISAAMKLLFFCFALAYSVHGSVHNKGKPLLGGWQNINEDFKKVVNFDELLKFAEEELKRRDPENTICERVVDKSKVSGTYQLVNGYNVRLNLPWVQSGCFKNAKTCTAIQNSKCDTKAKKRSASLKIYVAPLWVDTAVPFGVTDFQWV